MIICKRYCCIHTKPVWCQHAVAAGHLMQSAVIWDECDLVVSLWCLCWLSRQGVVLRGLSALHLQIVVYWCRTTSFCPMHKWLICVCLTWYPSLVFHTPHTVIFLKDEINFHFLFYYQCSKNKCFFFNLSSNCGNLFFLWNNFPVALTLYVLLHNVKVPLKERLFTRWPYLQRLRAKKMVGFFTILCHIDTFKTVPVP